MKLLIRLIKLIIVLMLISPFIFGGYIYFHPLSEKLTFKLLMKNNLFFIAFVISFFAFLFFLAYYIYEFLFREKDRGLRIEKVFITYFIIFSCLLGLGFGWLIGSVENLIGIRGVRFYKPKIPTKIYDVKGRLIAEVFEEHRIPVSIEDIPRVVINAFLEVEDKNFFHHIGVDFKGIIRAFISNVRAGKIKQGGSTITQQLAKALFTKGERTLYRKVLEVWLALQLERRFSKLDILEMYFNHIYFGGGAYGIESASRLYFGKSINKIGLAEACILARLPARPSLFSPLRHPDIAKKYNKIILLNLAKEGYITKYDALRIHREFWKKYIRKIQSESPFKTAWDITINKAPYFVDYVMERLRYYLGKDYDIYDGLKVYTTLDLDVQKIAEEEFLSGIEKADKRAKSLKKHYYDIVDRKYLEIYDFFSNIFGTGKVILQKSTNEKKKNFFDKVSEDILFSSMAFSYLFGGELASRNIEAFLFSKLGKKRLLDVEGALVSIKPSNGYITAMIGGKEYSPENQFNRATKGRRQPGSAFKPFVYLTALDVHAITPATVIPDTPMRNIRPDESFWEPKNYSKTYRGLIRIRDALAYSVNIVSIRIYDRVDAELIADYSSRLLKIPKSRFKLDPSLALGTSEVTPLELATGYTIIANEGKDIIPFAIRYVVDKAGIEILAIEDEIKRKLVKEEIKNTIYVIPKPTAWLITNLMEDVVNRGTAKVIRDFFIGDAAGKTGTSSDWNDAWFCGFTKDLVTVIWMGYDRHLLTLGGGSTGGELCAPVWGRIYKRVYTEVLKKHPPHFPPPPNGVYETAICPYSGKIPGPNCPKIGEYFLEGTGPDGVCDGVHIRFFSLSHWIRTKQLLFKIQKSGINSLSNQEMKFLKRYGIRVFDNLHNMMRICEKIHQNGEDSLTEEEKNIIAPLYSTELPKNF